VKFPLAAGHERGGVKILTPDQVAKRVAVVQKVYCFFACLGGLGVPYVLLGLSNKYRAQETPELMFFVYVYFLAYYGLKRRRAWAIPLLPIMSALTFLWSLLTVLTPADNVTAFLGKTVDAALALFGAYQIALFQRREVKQFLGAKGQILV